MEIEQQTDAYMQTTASRWRQTDRWKRRRKNRKRNKKIGILVEVLMNDSWKTSLRCVQDIEFWCVLF